MHYSESEESETLRTQTQNATSTPSWNGVLPVTPPVTPPPADHESPCLRVDGISASWSYDREKLVLSKISLEVNKVSIMLLCSMEECNRKMNC